MQLVGRLVDDSLSHGKPSTQIELKQWTVNNNGRLLRCAKQMRLYFESLYYLGELCADDFFVKFVFF